MYYNANIVVHAIHLECNLETFKSQCLLRILSIIFLHTKYVCIFYDLHYVLFSITGPNHVSLFKADGELSDLNSKLLLYYTPQVIH